MKRIAALAALSALLLSSCSGGMSQQQIDDSIRAASEAFFSDLEEFLQEPEPSATLIETGRTILNSPDPGEPPDWIFPPHEESPVEPSNLRPTEPDPNDPPEAWDTWRAAVAAWEAERAQWEADMAAWEAARAAVEHAWRASHMYLTYDGWGFWSTLNGEPLFKAVLNGDGTGDGGCNLNPAAECAPLLPDGLTAEMSGPRTGTNPIVGSAVWIGHARAARGGGEPVTGQAHLEADFGAATIDVHLTGLGFHGSRTGVSWSRVPIVNGAFGRVDEEPAPYQSMGSSVEGAFYGPAHEGVAGEFAYRDMVGVFGALRE